jgi:hypothetical protein
MGSVALPNRVPSCWVASDLKGLKGKVLEAGGALRSETTPIFPPRLNAVLSYDQPNQLKRVPVAVNLTLSQASEGRTRRGYGSLPNS